MRQSAGSVNASGSAAVDFGVADAVGAAVCVGEGVIVGEAVRAGVTTDPQPDAMTASRSRRRGIDTRVTYSARLELQNGARDDGLFVNDALAAEAQRETGAMRTRVSNFKRVTL